VLLFFILLVSVNANLLLATGNMLKLYLAANKRKKSIILSLSYVSAGMNLSTALSDKYIACKNCLAISLLDTKTLGLGITAVFSRTNALFMSEELQTEL